MAAKKAPLIEAWMGDIYMGNDCPDGMRALAYLQKCLKKGIVSDKEVWDGASPAIKKAFINHFAYQSETELARENIQAAIKEMKRNKLGSTAALEKTLASLQKQADAGHPTASYINGKAAVTGWQQ